MRNIFGIVRRVLENRPAKLARRLQLLAEKEKLEKPLRQAVKEAENERQRLRDILDGVAVVSAQKTFERGMAPINEELRGLTRELQQNPPAAIADFLEECGEMERRLHMLLNEKPDTLRQDEMGEPLIQVRVDRDSVLDVTEGLRQKVSAANALVLLDLSAAELSKRIEALRARPLPEIKKQRLERESAWAPTKETAIA